MEIITIILIIMGLQMIDIHCHILPNLDDGPKNIDTAIELSKSLIKDNITTVIATPHMLNGIYEVFSPDVYKQLEVLQSALKRENIPLTIHPGAEVHISSEIPIKLHENQILTLCDGGKYLLLELPDHIWPQNLNDIIFQLQLKNISTIIAHPERIEKVQQDTTILDSLIENEVLMQVTASGVTGKFGKQAQKCCYNLLERNMVHVVATDAHSHMFRTPLMTDAKEQVYEWFGEKTVEKLFDINPSSIMNGKDIEIEKPKTVKKGWKKWFF